MSRGAFNPLPEDHIPDVAADRDARTVVLVGNAGPSMWAAFRRGGSFSLANPLDTWTRKLLTPLAKRFEGRAVYPFDGPPYHPFQCWARRADAVHSSPMGPLIHSEFGLWHAYRGAIILAERLAVPEPVSSPSPCDNCEARPCLATCPVGALELGKFDITKCTEHVTSGAGIECRESGCLARRACPVGHKHIYSTDQAQFHMAAFLRAANSP